MSFLIQALPEGPFQHLFKRSDVELVPFQAIRMTATSNPGYPCRVTLQDAEVGESVVLVHYEHLSVNTPFRASHAIFVRENARQAQPLVDDVPLMFRSRTVSLRGFDEVGMLKSAELAEGKHLEEAIEAMFEDKTVAFIHLHFAKPGCYAALVSRA